MAKIYLRAFGSGELSHVPIETLVALFTIKYCDSNVEIFLVESERKDSEYIYLVDLTMFQYKFIKFDDVSKISRACELPNLELDEKNCIAGLCGTLRQIIKNILIDFPDHSSRSLLGFKEQCLSACSEASIWTKFCEIDIVSMVGCKLTEDQEDIIPLSLAKFENHMSQPVKLHNLFKYTMSKKFAGDNVTKDRKVLPEHTFAEGLSLTLSDVIIFVCIHIYFNSIDRTLVSDKLPLTIKWYENMLTDEKIMKSLEVLSNECIRLRESVSSYSLPCIENYSLYKSDPKRYKPKNRIYTHQKDIDNSLEKIRSGNIQFGIDELFAQDQEIDWSNIPLDATPQGGDLPNKRLKRKFEQLESLCKPILKLSKKGDIIVDFCSGGGHLGILVAYLLPDCKVILLENKALSMQKAKERVGRLGLKNVIFYQCNLDYFKGSFNIGACLHACGVATDLVLQQCIQRNAAFVCCPCCYGSIQDCSRIVYPRSQLFENVLEKRNYFNLVHASDQTHDTENVKTKQGYECMTIVDTDRKVQAEESGYKVYLNKLTPETCSPKNHLLIGWPYKLNYRFCNSPLT
ncbi:unnamed protein product [Trichogramma brassicae]|uniref:Methyltransferase domain-containing protein n=1 Tax=Trichogramma brassicae TaxID=86971 RepID=A0A6H5IEE2_9HYME|nr:unnamed protein product [Trichogramma brassicae]